MEDFTELLNGIDLEEVDEAISRNSRSKGKSFSPEEKAGAIRRVLVEKMTYVDAGRPINAEGYYVRRWVLTFRQQVEGAKQKAASEG